MPPVASCTDATVQLDPNGILIIDSITIDNGSADTCGIATMEINPNTFSCTDIGGNTVTLTVTDTNNNTAICTATVTVEDTTPPAVQCQDITIQLDETGNVAITAGVIDNGSSDACGINTMSVSSENFTCADLGGNTVTLTVTDINGNSDICEATVTVLDRNIDGDPVTFCNGDCDDADPNTHPGATELCDGLDNDCDGTPDNGIISAFYADADGDGYGDLNNTIEACIAFQGYVTDNTDCADADPNTHPGATELCDDLDNDCDGLKGPDETDSDSDGFMICEGDCDDNNRYIYPNASGRKMDEDNDCSGYIESDERKPVPVGYSNNFLFPPIPPFFANTYTSAFNRPTYFYFPFSFAFGFQLLMPIIPSLPIYLSYPVLPYYPPFPQYFR